MLDLLSQLQLSRLSELETHLASLGARIPDLAQTTSYLDAFSISSRPMQVDSHFQTVLTGSDPNNLF